MTNALRRARLPDIIFRAVHLRARRAERYRPMALRRAAQRAEAGVFLLDATRRRCLLSRAFAPLRHAFGLRRFDVSQATLREFQARHRYELRYRCHAIRR